MSVGLGAKIDQLGAMLRDLAPALAVYYRGLVEAGVPHESAALIVAGAQDKLFGGQREIGGVDRAGGAGDD